jgi:predicted Fe-Mo cluster-binding NifX family protein
MQAEGRTTTDSEQINPTVERVALPVKVPELDATLESKFGRAAFLLLVNPKTLAFEAVKNPAREARSGAGIAAAELLGKNKITGVIAENFGPKAREALTAAAIPMYQCQANLSVREAVGRFTAGELITAGEKKEETRRRP